MSKPKMACKPPPPSPEEMKNIKFPMHNTHLRKTLGILRTACYLSILAPLLFYVLHNAPRKMKYQQFYTHYDPLDAFDRMKSGGYFNSCPAKEEKKEKGKDKKKK
ncbi:hypothetical protein AWZ03_014637 [Drosophila navojoa]|uniref:Uncharacterized protein n=1 Tax=Drosophila navojoa TaxID=7232 RepID=A0A484ATL0_DRONA|nr:uncharacterized protein LOC115565404 [Drosophila navojoa]TDG38941.1 hypothetical protein AWZ03_014637 [Drosophila navojoa]